MSSPYPSVSGKQIRLLFKTFYYYSDLRRTYVWLISAEGGKPRQIASGDYDYHSISYSPDGKWIASVSNRTGKDDYNSNNDICLLSTEGKEMVQLTDTIGPEYWPVWFSRRRTDSVPEPAARPPLQGK